MEDNEPMVDEPTEDVIEEIAEHEIVDRSPEEVKKLARGMGWVDGKNFKGNPEAYVDAETFIRKTHDVNTGLRKQVKEITNVVSELKVHNERVYKAELKRLEKEITDLRAQRRTAIEDGDVERVEKIEQEIDEIRGTAEIHPPATPPTNPVWTAWVEENSWYDEDKEMREFADEAGKEYDGLPFEKILKLVRKDVMAEFPDRFGSDKTKPKRPGASPVESGARRAASKTRTRADLSPAQRNAMNQFVRAGVMTESEYIRDLVKMGEI